MPKSKKLQKQIENKLEQLKKLLNQITEAQNINSENPNTWDIDTLYDLSENCKEVIKLLENKKHPQEKDPWGEPIILEEGLLSLVDDYTSEEEESEDI